MQREHDAVMAAIRGRRSIRSYEDRPLDDGTVQAIIDAGIHAPTALGLQPWQFIVVRDQTLMKQISEYCKPFLRAALRDATDEASIAYREILAHEEYDIFYDAPVLVLVLGDVRNRYSIYDCTLCAGTMMLAAHALGVGSCWIGSAEPVSGSPEFLAALGVPEGWRTVAPIIFGYPKGTPEPQTRRDPVITWIG
ncbi:nitroreductase [Methanofollis sp. UBA420]|jgi:nitroreductase|uniref:nitroreductase family protein n=1 Tax=Methanofollis sp. UBA420 TaxID=1915514 RepID=UPI00316AD8F5